MHACLDMFDRINITAQVPLLRIDGLNLVQSHAIIRYLARKHHLYGDNDVEAVMYVHEKRVTLTVLFSYVHMYVRMHILVCATCYAECVRVRACMAQFIAVLLPGSI